jgi:hypothetical protein
MADKEHLAILKQGVEVWNRWRKENPDIRPDLVRANLIKANLSEAHLGGVNFGRADLHGANLRGADLSPAFLLEANLRGADLHGANRRGATLRAASLSWASLHEADFTEARVSLTVFGDLDLSLVKGLETVRHSGPSIIGIDTIYRSRGKIPEAFLRGCGVPDTFIAYMGSLTGKAFEYYSCFISYSTQDDAFAQRLHADLQDNGVRCWFAPEDIKAGEKLYPQIDQAIRLHDKLLLILSEHSMHSEWVMTEIRRARQAELRDGRRKLFPIRLVDWETIRDWECFDADTGKDLAVEVREYFVPDFSCWKEHDSYQEAFERLLRDLKASEA